MTVGAWIAIAVLLAATAFGLWRRRTDGHFRASGPGSPVIAPTSAPADTPSDQADPPPRADAPHVQTATPGDDVPAAEAASSAQAAPSGGSSESTSEPLLDADGHLPSADSSDWAHPEHSHHDLVRRMLGDSVTPEQYGERATLVQFSSAFCAPCRVARRVLGEVAVVVPGVTHVEVDAEAHLDLVRALGIVRTPTTIVLDATGREVSRAVGAPRKEQVVAALGEAL